MENLLKKIAHVKHGLITHTQSLRRTRWHVSVSFYVHQPTHRVGHRVKTDWIWPERNFVNFYFGRFEFVWSLIFWPFLQFEYFVWTCVSRCTSIPLCRPCSRKPLNWRVSITISACLPNWPMKGWSQKVFPLPLKTTVGLLFWNLLFFESKLRSAHWVLIWRGFQTLMMELLIFCGY